MEKQTWKDKNIKNTTIREQFIPSISTIQGIQKITYKFDAPYFLNKKIEMDVTNNLGYTKPHKKLERNISTTELRDYLRRMDSIVKNNEIELRNSAFNNMIYLIKNIEIPKSQIDKIKKGVKYLIKERDMYKKLYEDFLTSAEKKLGINSTEKLTHKDENQKKKSLFSRLF